MARKSNLYMMPIQALLKLRDDVAKAISSKASALRSQLSQLGRANSNRDYDAAQPPAW